MAGGEEPNIPVKEPVRNNLRVRLCLQTNELMCGPYSEALIVDVKPNATTSAGLMGGSWMIIVVVVLVILALVALMIAARCLCCRQTKTLKPDGANGRPTIIHGTQPPPYSSAFSSENNGGIENKGADGSVKDVSDDNIKAALFTNTTQQQQPNG